MGREKLQFANAVTLVGGGEMQRNVLDQALDLAPNLIAADGAADRLAEMGHQPHAVIGDMDSISDLETWRDGPAKLLHLTEQETTDFEKCLNSIEAPLFVCVGFTGGRADHTLAVFHSMLRHSDRRIVLLSPQDAIALMPEDGLSTTVSVGSRVSFYPLVPVMGVASEGLEWPVDGLEMEVGRQIGTSNIASQSEISVRFDRIGALIILDRSDVNALIEALS